jgi:hypothetical protein
MHVTVTASAVKTGFGVSSECEFRRTPVLVAPRDAPGVFLALGEPAYCHPRHSGSTLAARSRSVQTSRPTSSADKGEELVVLTWRLASRGPRSARRSLSTRCQHLARRAARVADGRDGNAAGLADHAVLRATLLAGGAVAGPLDASAGGRRQPGPTGGWRDEVGLAQRDGADGRSCSSAGRGAPSPGQAARPGIPGDLFNRFGPWRLRGCHPDTVRGAGSQAATSTTTVK